MEIRIEIDIHFGSTSVNLTVTLRTLRGCFENVINSLWIWPCYNIEDHNEWKISTFRIALLAGFDKAFSVADYPRVR